jgi:hypothetical protein
MRRYAGYDRDLAERDLDTDVAVRYALSLRNRSSAWHTKRANASLALAMDTSIVDCWRFAWIRMLEDGLDDSQVIPMDDFFVRALSQDLLDTIGATSLNLADLLRTVIG